MRITTKMVTLVLTIGFIFAARIHENAAAFKPETVNTASTYAYSRTRGMVEFAKVSMPTEVEELISEEDVEILALLTMAEAEGEPEEGKRLVIDAVLNRVDSEHFPDTIYSVIYQPYQFTPMWNGRADRCEVKEEICRLVREELESRTNYDVIFFTAGGYSDYGVPMFQVGNHYFSSYD